MAVAHDSDATRFEYWCDACDQGRERGIAISFPQPYPEGWVRRWGTFVNVDYCPDCAPAEREDAPTWPAGDTTVLTLEERILWTASIRDEHAFTRLAAEYPGGLKAAQALVRASGVVTRPMPWMRLRVDGEG